MLTITQAAEEKIANLVAESEKPVKGLRIGARLDPAKQVDYKLAFISDQQIGGDDQVVHFTGFDVYIDPESADSVGGGQGGLRRWPHGFGVQN